MVYVFDTSAFIVTGHYFPDRFPTFWQHLNELAETGRLVSASEVLKELDHRNTRGHLADWVKAHKSLFPVPTPEEMERVAQIFAIPNFQNLVSKKSRLQGTPVADPFVVARAAILGGCVVSEESRKPNAGRIPNVCEHFQVPCLNVEGFMGQEKWRY